MQAVFYLLFQPKFFFFLFLENIPKLLTYGLLEVSPGISLFSIIYVVSHSRRRRLGMRRERTRSFFVFLEKEVEVGLVGYSTTFWV